MATEDSQTTQSQKSAESLAYRAIEDLALEADSSVEQMLRLVDRLHRAERPKPAEDIPIDLGKEATAPQEKRLPRLDWDKCLQTFPVLHPKCKREYIESFRLLRARVSLAKREWAAGGAVLQVLAIVSTSSREGKSFVATNLAAALAIGSDEKVLIVDLNPLSNELSSSLGILKGPGVSEAMQSGQWESSVRQVGETNLYVLPAGRAAESRLDGIDFRRVPMLLESLRGTFAWIIIDGPAHADSSDAELLSNYADANLLVVQKGVTEFNEVAQLKEGIPEGRLLGAVLNNQTLKKSKSWFRRGE